MALLHYLTVNLTREDGLRDEGGDADEKEAVGLAATRVVALLKVLGASAAATGAPTAAEAQAHQRRD